MQQTNRIIAVADCMERLYFFNRMKWLDTIVVDAFPVMCVGYFAGAKMHYVKNKKFEEIFGIPTSVLHLLATILIFLVIYDVFCYQKHLKIGLISDHFSTITILDWAYIIVESILVNCLAMIEFRIGKRII